MRTTVGGLLAGSALAVALVLAACGGGDDDGGATADTGAGTTTTAPAAAPAGATTTTTAPVEEGGVPDPCTLIQAPVLAMMLAGDPGAGVSSAYDPEQRRICSYATGVILAVELADHYDEAIDIIRDETGDDSIHEVSGVGKAAVWQDVGDGVGRFIAQGNDYFVDVTLPSGNQDVGHAVAEAMLAAL